MSFNLFLSTSFSFSFLELPVSVKMGVPVGSQLHVVEILTSSFAPVFFFLCLLFSHKHTLL